uniref:Uncharacterized protein MANES_08G066900 n=1 Tax=Rhizophora mucronata TaxID=61149 RepID=A0A2P2JSA2_RHIMU
MLNLQRGHVAFIRSHLLMHLQWKWWLHGRVYNSTPSTYLERQMQHSESSGSRKSSLIGLASPDLTRTPSTSCFLSSSNVLN